MYKNRLVIRLHKRGRVGRPYYYIVVTNAYKSNKSSFLAKVGYYDPFTYKFKKNINALVVYKDKLNYWILKGACPNDSVRKLLFI